MSCFGCVIPAVLETGLDFIETDNETNLPCVKGYNIINGQLKVADQKTFESINPANKNDCLGIFPLSTKQDIDDAIGSENCLHKMIQYPAPPEVKLLEIWDDY